MEFCKIYRQPSRLSTHRWLSFDSQVFDKGRIAHNPQGSSAVYQSAMINNDKCSSSSPGIAEAAGLLSRNPIEIDPLVLGFVLETACDAIYIYDDQRHIIYANAQACKQSGYSKSELLQMNIGNLDAAYPAATPEMFMRFAELGKQTIFESVHRTKSGQLLPVEVSLVTATFKGKIFNSAFVRDISRRMAIMKQSDHLRFALEHASDAVYLYDRSGQIHFANARASDVLGYSPDELLNKSIMDLDPLFSENNNLVFWDSSRKVMTRQTLHRKKDGSTYPVEIVATATSSEGQESAVCFVRDISEQMTAMQAVREGEERFRVIADTSPVALVISEINTGHIRYVNNQAARVFRLTRGEMMNLDYQDVLAFSHVSPQLIESVLEGHEFQNSEVELLHGDVQTWVSFNTSVLTLEGEQMLYSALMDVTEAHELSNQLSYQATYDDLTGLVNRREFEDRLQEVIELGAERQIDNALCYLDLDQFKVINDTCGHMAGDELLRQLAQLLYKCVRRDDTLARLGGDEFAILLENCSIENAEKVANNVQEMIRSFRFAWLDSVFTIGISIGLTQIARAGETISEVLRRADAACYAAKKAGRNRLHVFRMDDKEIELRHVEMRWVSRINAALDENRFELWSQEIAEISHHNTQRSQTAEDHFEVLLRMRDIDGTLILPGDFLLAAERYDLASRIDRWVIRVLFKWLSNNQSNMHRLGICTVNLSGQTLGDDGFQQEVIALVESSSLPAEKICFEITETAAITNLSSATTFMKRMKAYGCKFSLDDFGRGLSSFAYLKSLPVDFVKIDGFFVKDMLTDTVDYAMVKAIIDMAHAMGIKAIAEFVENNEILNALIDLDVDYVQGFGIARPVRLV